MESLYTSFCNGCNIITFKGYSGSYAESFAEKNNIPFEMISTAVQTGDITGDGIVDIEDAQIILNYYELNQISEMPTAWEKVLGKSISENGV